MLKRITTQCNDYAVFHHSQTLHVLPNPASNAQALVLPFFFILIALSDDMPCRRNSIELCTTLTEENVALTDLLRSFIPMKAL